MDYRSVSVMLYLMLECLLVMSLVFLEERKRAEGMLEGSMGSMMEIWMVLVKECS